MNRQSLTKLRTLYYQPRYLFTSIQLNEKKDQVNYYKSLRIYKEKTNYELFNLFFVNKLLHYAFFVNNSMKAYKLSSSLFGFKTTEFFIKNTMGKIFTGGSSISDVLDVQKSLQQRNVPIIYDYCCEALEEDQNEFFMDNSAKLFEQTARIGDKIPNNKISMKISALCNMDILEALNRVAQKQQRLFDTIDQQKQGIITGKQLFDYLTEKGYVIESEDIKQFIENVLQIKIQNDNFEEVQIKKIDWLIFVHPYYIQPEKNENNIVKQMQKLQKVQIDQCQNFVRRMNLILDTSSNNKTRVLIDAEQTYIQQTIDSFIQQFQYKYNREVPIVYNTFQNYLKSSKQRVQFEIEKCKYLNIPFGIKMVRGAYMNEERKIAKEEGTESPICESFEQTSEMMNSNLKYIVDNIFSNSEIIIGSHNKETIEMITQYLNDKNMKDNKQIYFAQLLGLADHLTYQLVQKGFTVYKYVPFGETHIMIPYLIRRAQESFQVLSSVELQYALIKDEFKKRTIFSS